MFYTKPLCIFLDYLQIPFSEFIYLFHNVMTHIEEPRGSDLASCYKMIITQLTLHTD